MNRKTFRIKIAGLSVIECIVIVQARTRSEAESLIIEYYGKHFVNFT